MLERVIENWLDNATERSWQRPFCAILTAQGHRVLHSTRHSATELGVDVLSLDSEGALCAFQLKSAPRGRIRLSDWRDISSQVDSMVCRQIDHPSIPSAKNHTSYLVTDGFLDEEVTIEINDRNRQWVQQGNPHRKIRTIERGGLLEWAKDLGIALWPSELSDVKLLLEIYLEDGRGQIPKEKLADLLERTCRIDDDSEKPKSNAECARALSSGALLCSIALANYSNNENHQAEIETWTMFAVSALACAERWRLPAAYYERQVQLALDFIQESLKDLLDEVKGRRTLIEGDGLYDSPFRFLHARATWLSAAFSVLALWMRRDGECDWQDTSTFAVEFLQQQKSRLWLWARVPYPSF